MIRKLLGVKRNVTSLLACFLLLASYFFAPTALADTMSNDNYSIDTANITIGNILHNNTANNNNNAIKPIQTAVEKNYQIEDDFANSSISLSLSSDTINFGTLSSTDPVLRQAIIAIANNKGGYELSAFEDHVLTSIKSATIPDTSCDNGSCSQTTAAEWSSALTYGFGYRCDNLTANPCPPDFIQSDYYKPFSNRQLKQISQAIIQSPFPTPKQRAQITYKINISGTQPGDSYHNTITYLVAPGF